MTNIHLESYGAEMIPVTGIRLTGGAWTITGLHSENPTGRPTLEAVGAKVELVSPILLSWNPVVARGGAAVQIQSPAAVPDALLKRDAASAISVNGQPRNITATD